MTSGVTVEAFLSVGRRAGISILEVTVAVWPNTAAENTNNAAALNKNDLTFTNLETSAIERDQKG